MRKLVPCLTALSLVATGGCDKGKKKSGKRGAGPMASTSAPTKRPPPRRIAVSTKVLPIPADLPALRFNVAKLRATAWFKRAEATVRKALTQSRLGAAMGACKIDPINSVEGATLGTRQKQGQRADVIVILKVPGLSPTILTCLKDELTKRKVAVKQTRLASRAGLAMQLDDRATAIVSLRSDQLMIILGRLRQRVADVLSGKAPSITSTSLYREVNGQVGPDSLFGAIVPGVISDGCKGLPPLLRSFKTGALLLNVPRGKSTLKVNLHFEDKARAATVSKRLPTLLQLAATRHANTPSVPGAGKARPGKGWTYLDFALDDRTFTQLLGLVQTLLGPARVTPATPKKGAIVPKGK